VNIDGAFLRESLQLAEELMIIVNKTTEFLGFKKDKETMSFASKTQLLSA